MSLPVVLRTAAQAELDDAFDWYERQRPGLGVAFLAAAQDAFDRIAAMPLAHGLIFQDTRCALVRRYPYSVFYKIEPNQVVVLSVFHGKHDPRIWQGRA